MIISDILNDSIELARRAAAARDFLTATTGFQRVLVIDPSNAEALHSLGLSLSEIDNCISGLEWVSRSIAQGNLDISIARTNRAIIYQKLSRYDEADADLRRVRALNKLYVPALLNLGHVAKELGQYERAIQFYEMAIAAQPDEYAAYDHLVYCYEYPCNLSKRVRSARHAHYLVPNDPNCAYSFSLYCLMTGNFSVGWDLFLRRWEATHTHGDHRYTTRVLPQITHFDGQTTDSPVLIWAEQGLGDEIMFLSCIADFIERFSVDTIVQVDKRMMPIFKRSFPGIKFLARPSLPYGHLYQYHLPMGDLPRYVRRTAGDFVKGGRSFLHVDEAKKRQFWDRLHTDGKFVVGLGWSSSNGSTRCIPLLQLAQILAPFDIVLVNLQYGDTTSEVNYVEKNLGRKLFTDTGVDCTHDLDSLASLMKSCDLVISVANSTVHLAGALGVTTYALLPYFPGWRWLTTGTDCLWYKSVLMIRQTSLGDWQSVFDELTTNLSAKLMTHRINSLNYPAEEPLR